MKRLVGGGQGGGTEEYWADYRTAVIPGGLQIDGLPRGLVRVELVCAGYREAKSEPVPLTDALQAVAPVVTLVRGRDIRVRVEPPVGLELPEKIRFRVRGTLEGPTIAHHSRRLAGEPVWVLSAFAPGELEVSADTGSAFRTARATVVVPRDRDAEVVLHLEEKGLLPC